MAFSGNFSLHQTEPGLELSLTPWCAQYMWPGDVFFPSCPVDFGKNRLEDYFHNLVSGAILAYYDNSTISSKLIIIEAEMIKGKDSIIVFCKRNDSKYIIVWIKLNDKFHFIHYLLGLFQNREEAQKEYLRILNLDNLGTVVNTDYRNYI